MNDERAARFTGGCLCENVRIEASGSPYRVGLCHCLDCRKHHGALFFAAAIFAFLSPRAASARRTASRSMGMTSACLRPAPALATVSPRFTDGGGAA